MSVELLAPAGDFKTALAAFAAGADAVYCGLADYSARAFARNLSLEELNDLVRYAHSEGVGGKVYVAFNTLVDEDDLRAAVETLSRIADIRPDAVILQDIGIARICREYFPELEMHASTQLVAHNLEGVLELKEMGFRRVVLARELSLEEISSIVKRSGAMEFECFIHGALCYSISGLCLYGAMEKGRSGNRGKCPYCCRLPHEDPSGVKSLPYSMRDLRVDEDVMKLVAAGVKSLKIEGRMKSDLYVASAVGYYRGILDGGKRKVTGGDIETVFSRRTTKLYLDAPRRTDREAVKPVDPGSLGHLGALIGTVKRVTKDREGFSWLRFHTSRALERHDGLQFDARDENGKSLGMGIGDMRQAISRRGVFEVPAGSDVEVLLPPDDAGDSLARQLRPGMKIFCSASQAVRRLFPQPSVRMSDYPGRIGLEIEVELAAGGIAARTYLFGERVEAFLSGSLEKARNPEKTESGVFKAFSRLGGTDYHLARLKLQDEDGLFAPASLLNDLRRDLAEKLDDVRERVRSAKVEAVFEGEENPPPRFGQIPMRVLKIRPGMKIPPGEWDEVVLSLAPGEDFAPPDGADVRIALPVYTSEPEFNRLRVMVKGLIRRGFAKWEASDLATLRMLRGMGVEDITADWSLYAFNSSALEELSRLGVRRFVASPENTRSNIAYLEESGYPVEFLAQQSTPLFISLTPPASTPADLAVYERAGLWITVRPAPRTFNVGGESPSRVDLSWDVPT